MEGQNINSNQTEEKIIKKDKKNIAQSWGYNA